MALNGVAAIPRTTLAYGEAEVSVRSRIWLEVLVVFLFLRIDIGCLSSSESLLDTVVGLVLRLFVGAVGLGASFYGVFCFFLDAPFFLL